MFHKSVGNFIDDGRGANTDGYHQAKQMTFFGHLMRKEGPENFAVTGLEEDKRTRENEINRQTKRCTRDKQYHRPPEEYQRSWKVEIHGRRRL